MDHYNAKVRTFIETTKIEIQHKEKTRSRGTYTYKCYFQALLWFWFTLQLNQILPCGLVISIRGVTTKRYVYWSKTVNVTFYSDMSRIYKYRLSILPFRNRSLKCIVMSIRSAYNLLQVFPTKKNEVSVTIKINNTQNQRKHSKRMLPFQQVHAFGSRSI